MAERLFDPNDTSDDIVLRLSSEEAHALYSLLNALSYDEKLKMGLTHEQCVAISRIMHATY